MECCFFLVAVFGLGVGGLFFRFFGPVPPPTHNPPTPTQNCLFLVPFTLAGGGKNSVFPD